MKKSAAAFADRIDGNPRAMMLIARTMAIGSFGQESDFADAIAMARRAIAASDGDPEITARGRDVFSSQAPDYHFPMLHDRMRNEAYQAALRRAIRPGDRVLEIGSGSGVMAMIAARCGAEVVTCEMNPVMAEVAQQIIARNGYADRVRVIARHSNTLDAESDLGGRMDLLVSELFTNDMLRDQVLAAHTYAMRHLLKPGAQVIPIRGRVRVALAELTDEDEKLIGEICGFDLSPFNMLRHPLRTLSSKSVPLLRSEPADLFTFELAASAHAPSSRTTLSLPSLGGRINGIAQWIQLEMDEQLRYENAPGVQSHWGVNFRALPQALHTREGDMLRVSGWHNYASIAFWLESP